jgi:hypothetical protein
MVSWIGNSASYREAVGHVKAHHDLDDYGSRLRLAVNSFSTLNPLNRITYSEIYRRFGKEAFKDSEKIICENHHNKA